MFVTTAERALVLRHVGRFGSAPARSSGISAADLLAQVKCHQEAIVSGYTKCAFKRQLNALLRSSRPSGCEYSERKYPIWTNMSQSC